MAQALERVRTGGGAHPRHHVGELGADQRHLAHGLFVGLGGEQAHEARFAHGAAVGVVALDPHVIHVGAPVHPREQVGLGHGERARRVQVGGQVAGEDGRLAGAAQHGALRVAQHAEAGGGRDARLLRGVGPRSVAGVLVLARAQEHEAVVVQPAQEGLRLAVRGRAGGGRHGRRRLRHQCGHGGVVVHRRAHVGQRGLHGGDHQGAPVLADGGQGHHDQRLVGRPPALRRPEAGGVARHLHHRVGQGAHLQPRFGQLAHDAVDQEGPVGLDHAQHVVGPGRGGSEVDRPAAGRPRRRLRPQPHVRQQGRRRLARVARSDQVVPGQVAPGLAHEAAHVRVQLPAAQAAADAVFHVREVG